MRQDENMKQWLAKSVAPLLAGTAVCGFAVLCGCEKKREVYTVRGKDPAYQKELHATTARQNAKAAVLARLEPQLESLVARARDALPKGATDEAVRAELDAHPEKYPGWKALSAAKAKANADLEREMARARATVRARILKEAADRKAVAEGRAAEKKTPGAAK